MCSLEARLKVVEDWEAPAATNLESALAQTIPCTPARSVAVPDPQRLEKEDKHAIKKYTQSSEIINKQLSGRSNTKFSNIGPRARDKKKLYSMYTLHPPYGIVKAPISHQTVSFLYRLRVPLVPELNNFLSSLVQQIAPMTCLP